MNQEVLQRDQRDVVPSLKSRNSVHPSQEKLAPDSKDPLYSFEMALNEWVRAARKHAGLTQEAFGEQLGVGKANVSAWETGKHNPSLAQVVEIERITKFEFFAINSVSQTQVEQKPETPPAQPKTPPRNFQYRQEVDESDWAMLQDISALPKEERDVLKSELRQKAEKYRRFAEEIIGKLNK